MEYLLVMSRRCSGEAFLKIVHTFIHNKQQEQVEYCYNHKNLKKNGLYKESEAFKRYNLSRKHKADKDIINILDKIKVSKVKCNFPIKDTIVKGVNEEEISCKFIKIPDMTLKQCVDSCSSLVVNSKGLKMLNTVNVFKL